MNVNIGGGTGGAGRSGQKRRRDDDEVEEEWEEVDAVDKDASEAENEDNEPYARQPRRNGSDRRKETLGQRKVDKEVYKKGIERKKQKSSGSQWSR